MTIIGTFARLIADESGATAIEYGLIASLVAVGAITAMTELGSSLSSMFEAVAENMQVTPST